MWSLIIAFFINMLWHWRSFLLFVKRVCCPSVDSVRVRASNLHVFKALCQEIGSQYTTLLLRTEILWLPRGKCVATVFDLRYLIEMSLREKESVLLQLFIDPKLLISLARLEDMFTAVYRSDCFGGRIEVSSFHGSYLSSKEDWYAKTLQFFPPLMK
jgi:hypothetical protein